MYLYKTDKKSFIEYEKNTVSGFLEEEIKI
jgi:hypothetical protein